MWRGCRATFQKNMGLEGAVDKAMDDMPGDYSIRPLLMENRAEVKAMCLTEYDEAETMKLFKEEGREEGEDKMGKKIPKRAPPAPFLTYFSTNKFHTYSRISETRP